MFAIRRPECQGYSGLTRALISQLFYTCPDGPSSARMKRSVHWSHLHKPSFKTSVESFSHQHLLGLRSHHRPPVQCGRMAQARQACPTPTRRWHGHCRVQRPRPGPKGVPDRASWRLPGPAPSQSWTPSPSQHSGAQRGLAPRVLSACSHFLLATASRPVSGGPVPGPGHFPRRLVLWL